MTTLKPHSREILHTMYLTEIAILAVLKVSMVGVYAMTAVIVRKLDLFPQKETELTVRGTQATMSLVAMRYGKIPESVLKGV